MLCAPPFRQTRTLQLSALAARASLLSDADPLSTRSLSHFSHESTNDEGSTNAGGRGLKLKGRARTRGASPTMSWAESRAAALTAARDDWEAQVVALRQVGAGAAEACARSDARLSPIYLPLGECITSLRSSVARAACAAATALAAALSETPPSASTGDATDELGAATGGERFEAEQLASALAPALLSAVNQSLAVLREDALLALVAVYAATGGSRNAVERCAAVATGDPAPRRRLAASACLEEGIRVWPRAAARRAAPTLLAVAGAQAADAVAAVRAAGRRLFVATARIAPDTVESSIKGIRVEDPPLAAKLERWAADANAQRDPDAMHPEPELEDGAAFGRRSGAKSAPIRTRSEAMSPNSVTVSPVHHPSVPTGFASRLLRRPASRIAPAGEADRLVASASNASGVSGGQSTSSPTADAPYAPSSLPIARVPPAPQQDDLAMAIETSFVLARRARRSIGGAALRVAVRRSAGAEAVFPEAEAAGMVATGCEEPAEVGRAPSVFLSASSSSEELTQGADALPSGQDRKMQPSRTNASRGGSPVGVSSSRDANSPEQPSGLRVESRSGVPPPLASHGGSRDLNRAISPEAKDVQRASSRAASPSDPQRGSSRRRPGEVSVAITARFGHGRSAYATPLAVLCGALAPWAERCAAYLELEKCLHEDVSPKAVEEKLGIALVTGCSTF